MGIVVLIVLLVAVLGVLFLIRQGRKHNAIYQEEAGLDTSSLQQEADMLDYIRLQYFQMKFKLVYVQDEDGVESVEIRDRKSHLVVGFAQFPEFGETPVVREVKQGQK